MLRHDTHDDMGPAGSWLSKQDAARLVGISIRQLERRESQGYIRKHVLPRRAQQKTAPVVYLREDCEALKEGRAQSYGETVRSSRAKTAGEPLATLPAPDEASVPTALAPRAPQAAANANWDAFCRAVATAIAPREEPKPYLTIREAAEYSGLPVAYLRRMAPNGGFGAVDVASEGATKRAWRFRRAAF